MLVKGGVIIEISARKKQIINIAQNIFASKGYHGTSMNDIAKEVGINKASMYSHFENKESMFRLIFENILNEHSNNLIELINSIDEKSSIKKLEVLFLKYINYCKGNASVDFWIRFYYFPPEVLKNEIHSKTHKYEAIFEEKIIEIIEFGIKNNEIVKQNSKNLMIAYYNLMIGFVLSLNFYNDKDIKKDALNSIQILLKGHTI